MVASVHCGERLKYAREHKGLTQEQVAEKVHVTKQMVYRWEKGLNGIREEYREALEQLLGIQLMEHEKLHDVGEIKLCPLDQIKDLKDLSEQVKSVLGKVRIDECYKESVGRMLECAILLVLGYEIYYNDYQERLRGIENDPLYCPVCWEGIAEELEGLLDKDLYRIPEAFANRYLMEDGSVMKLKIHHMVFAIGSELEEDFDDDGWRNGYEQQIARLGRHCGNQLLMLIPSIENSIVTSLKCAMSETVEWLRTTG